MKKTTSHTGQVVHTSKKTDASPLGGTEVEPPMILYFASDLIWATKIKGAADALGLPCRPVRSMEMLEARLADSPVRSLIVDLDRPEEAMAMVRRVRSSAPVAGVEGNSAAQGADCGVDGAFTDDADATQTPNLSRAPATARGIRVLAFGPHVERTLLQQARDAGADDVLTRGAFDHNMPEILTSLAGRG